LILLVLPLGVNAYTNSDFRSLYEFDDSLEDEGLLNITLTGSTPSYATGKVGQASWSNNDKRFNMAVSSYSLQVDNNFTMCYWVNITANGGFYTIIDGRSSSIATPYLFWLNGASWYMQDSARSNTFGVKDLNNWQHNCIVQNHLNITNYQNGVVVSTSTTNKMQLGTGTGNIYIQKNSDNQNGLVGGLDQLFMSGRPFEAEEIRDIYNNGDGKVLLLTQSNFSITAIDSETSSTITNFNATIDGTLYNSIGGQINTTILDNSTSLYDIDLTSVGYYARTYANYNVSSNLEGSLTPYSITFINQTPANNTQYNDVLWREFDLNIDFSGDDFVSTTCDIMANDVIKQSITHTGNGTINYNSLDHPFTGTTYYNWTCYNDYTTLQTPTYVFYTDLVFPNLQTNFKNNTLVFENNLTGQFNFTDDQILYGWNISIDGSEVASNFTLDGATATSFDLNTATTALSVGDHTLNIWFADGHTAIVISDQKVSDGIFGDSLKFTLNNKWVKIENEVVDYSDRMTATKEKDRYTWEYTPAKVKNKYTFKVSASDNIKIVEAPDTPYKRWLIVDNRWMDFYTEDGYVDVSFKRISDKEVRVTLDFPKTKDVIKFKSIGELNIKETSYVFTKGNMTTEFTTPVTETTTQTYSLNVTRNIFTTSTATFNLADTERTITKTAHTNYDEYSTSFQLSFIDSLSEEQEGVWNITTTGTNIYTGQQNFTQRINSMNLSNCSGSISDETFEYVLREEQYASVVMGNITTSLKVWAEDEANSRVYTFTWRDVNVTPVCIYTNDSLNIIHTIDYVSNGFDSTNRIIFDSINKTKESISLYSALITSSFITNLIDRTGNSLVSHYIEFYKYSNFIAGYVLLESGLTDYAGNLLFGYEPAGKYRFKVYNTTLDEIYDTGSAGTYIVADPTIIRISSDINFSDTETDIYVPTDNSSWVNYTANNASIDVFSKEFRDDINPFYRFLLAIIIALVLGATFFPFLGTLGATAIAYGVFTSFAIITWISWIFPIILALLIFAGYIVLGGNEGT